MSKPLVLFICPDEHDDGSLHFGDALRSHPNQGPPEWQAAIIPMIEKSAYDKIQAQMIQIGEKQTQLIAEIRATFLSRERTQDEKLLLILQKIEDYSDRYLRHPEASHGHGRSLLGQLAEQVLSDVRVALDVIRGK